MQQPAPRSRLDSLDLLRGLVMVLMVLDHSRAFLGAGGDPMNLGLSSPGWYLTRWVTHLCAPGFVALAGVGAALYARRAGVPAAGRFLWTRGLWLVFLEITVVNTCWQLGFRHLSLLVIWALGLSMLVLALLVRIHSLAPLVFGLAVVLGHNLLSGLDPSALGPLAPAFEVALVPCSFELGALRVGISYPFLPWAGLMALGWAATPWLVDPSGVRPRRALALGLGMVAAFLVLRSGGLYGEPSPWVVHPRGALYTALGFLDCCKYPPSLQYLLMTLGPALLLLPLLPRAPGLLRAPLLVFGRVPLFFYLLHIPIIHVGARLWALGTVGPGGQLDPSLPRVYLGWALALLALRPLCVAWGRIKATQPWWWLRYL
jgi:uncharacterized membrane protein